jgi:type IV secretory pathway TraG/TraD family ATPase VirD4
MEVSRELYLEHGWDMPRGMIDHALRNPLSFSREEYQQAKRLCLDEFTNYPLPGLPEALTALGGYGIRVSMIVQELE